jgi:uncharacterized membrane protein YoaK (UPF0700 family)
MASRSESIYSSGPEGVSESTAARRRSRAAPVMRRLLALTMIMTLLAGFVDAVGYARLGQLYLSFMSGNSTRWGMALASSDRAVIGWGGTIIVTFVLGCMLGSLVAAASGRFKLVCVLASELVCLLTSLILAALAVGRPALLPIALAMGMQNAAHQVIYGSDTGKTFITGTLVSVGQSLAQVLLGHGRGAEAATSLASWCAFVTGVFFGAVSLADLGLSRALLIASATLAILVPLAWRLPPRVVRSGPELQEAGTGRVEERPVGARRDRREDV